MQKFFQKKEIVIILAAMLAGFGFAGNVFAACQGDPGELVVYVKDDACPLTSVHNVSLFNETDIAPGYSITGTLRIKNASTDSQTAIIEAVDFSNPLPDDDLARALNIAISLQGGGGYIYNDTLANFFQEREYKLAAGFAAGAENVYDVVVSFPADKGDYWQEKTTSFGLMVGFQGSDSKGVTLTTISGSGSAGGQVRGLIIQNEMAASITANSATIIWTTNHAASSWVVYAKEGESHLFDLTKTNYGYSHSTAEIDLDNNKTINHRITISGLEPNTTYYYRCVSHASLAVGVDHSFTTAAGGQVAGIQTERAGFDGVSSASTGANGTSGTAADGNAEPGQVAGAETERPDETAGAAAVAVQDNETAGAAAKAKVCALNFSWWIFLILAAICGWRAWANKKTRNYWLAGGVVPLAAAMWFYFNDVYCAIWKLFLAMALILLIVWFVDRRRK